MWTELGTFTGNESSAAICWHSDDIFCGREIYSNDLRKSLVNLGENGDKSTNKVKITKKSQKNGNYVGPLVVKRVASPRGSHTICTSS
jgi:hypothetical protein